LSQDPTLNHCSDVKSRLVAVARSTAGRMIAIHGF
jgi:hypothetical protein